MKTRQAILTRIKYIIEDNITTFEKHSKELDNLTDFWELSNEDLKHLITVIQEFNWHNPYKAMNSFKEYFPDI